MFEKEIKFISDFCVNKVKKLGNSFTFEKLSATELHPAVIRYISAELDYMIHADRKKLLQQSYFDYTGRQISQHFLEISDEIKKSKKITFEDTEKLIIQAVSFNANFVVRPKWSLIKLIYNDQQSISVDELEVMLKYVYYYDYIKNVLGAYLSKRKVVQLSLTEFELILNKIDRELFKSNSEQLIDNALSSIADFFNIGGVDKTTVSAQAVEILLKEKNLIEYLMKLRKNVPEGGRKKFSIEDLKRTLYLPVSGEAGSIAVTEISDSVRIEDALQDEINKLSYEDDTSTKETSIGELADKHAKEIEQSDPGELLNAEEEENLLSLYDDELKKFEDDVTEAISHKDDSAEFPFTENQDEDSSEDDEPGEDVIHQPGIKQAGQVNEVSEEEREKLFAIPEKDIVDEMIKDFFGEDESGDDKSPSDDSSATSPVDQVTDSPEERLVTDDINPENELEGLPPKLEPSLEDELLEVFDELDRLGDDAVADESFQDESEMSEFDLIDRDLETIDKIAFDDDNQEKVSAQSSDTVITSKKTPVNQQLEPVAEEKKETKTVIETPRITKPIQPNRDEASTLTKAPQIKKQVEEQDFEKPVRKKDLLSYLKRKDIKKIISYVFSGDREDFVTTAERIMDCHGYKEASEILRSVFSSYKVSHYSKDAITLTNAVSNYFRQT